MPSVNPTTPPCVRPVAAHVGAAALKATAGRALQTGPGPVDAVRKGWSGQTQLAGREEQRTGMPDALYLSAGGPSAVPEESQPLRAWQILEDQPVEPARFIGADSAVRCLKHLALKLNQPRTWNPYSFLVLSPIFAGILFPPHVFPGWLATLSPVPACCRSQMAACGVGSIGRRCQEPASVQ